MEMVAGVCVCTHADVHTHVWSQTHTDQEGKNMQESYGKHPNRRHASREASTETKQQCAFISSHPILTLTLTPHGNTHAHSHIRVAQKPYRRLTRHSGCVCVFMEVCVCKYVCMCRQGAQRICFNRMWFACQREHERLYQAEAKETLNT